MSKKQANSSAQLSGALFGWFQGKKNPQPGRLRVKRAGSAA